MITDETLTAPPDKEDPPTFAAATMYMSLLLSLLAAFAAMWGKRWLGDDLRSTGRTMIEHCGDRQRKHDEFKKWRFWIYIEAPPFMLYAAILLLVFGFYVNLATVNTTVFFALAPLVFSGLLYVLASFVGAAQHPHRPTLPVVPRNSGKQAGSRIAAAFRSVAAGICLHKHLSWSRY